ncbi:hypothetical protein L484_020524 [Morus notabilis]|uniref:Uncharacterized protein n=1 Tax=Morus notabilis TaxID=981085 RepID=W9SPW0_9ROSA|nr:hypothetical protein L484_020524 [Morus notabilis]
MLCQEIVQLSSAEEDSPTLPITMQGPGEAAMISSITGKIWFAKGAEHHLRPTLPRPRKLLKPTENDLTIDKTNLNPIKNIQLRLIFGLVPNILDSAWTKD